MRYLLTATAFLGLLAAVPGDAMAAGPGQGVQIVNNNYIINNNQDCNHNVGPNTHRSGYTYGRSYGSRSYGSRGYRSGGFETYDAAVARIKATHSRYRTNYHPRSYYNSAPHYYDYRHR